MLPVRGRRGYDVYAEGMEASAADKAKLLKYVRSGVIADLGCGTGTVLELLHRKFRSSSQFVGVDLSPEMVDRCRKRFPSVEIRRHDITLPLFDEGSIDTIILCSIMHEVFSYNGYDYSAVRQTIRRCAEAVRSGGRVIIRDGLKPAREDVVYLSFLNEKAYDSFVKFSLEFGSSEIVWQLRDSRIMVSRKDAMEFLTKYIYEVNWKYEVKEQFGVFTLAAWVEELRKVGLKVVHQESYVIDWLRVTHWEKDVRIEVKTAKGYRPTDYPHSTMILVGEK